MQLPTQRYLGRLVRSNAAPQGPQGTTNQKPVLRDRHRAAVRAGPSARHTYSFGNTGPALGVARGTPSARRIPGPHLTLRPRFFLPASMIPSSEPVLLQFVQHFLNFNKVQNE